MPVIAKLKRQPLKQQLLELDPGVFIDIFELSILYSIYFAECILDFPLFRMGPFVSKMKSFGGTQVMSHARAELNDQVANLGACAMLFGPWFQSKDVFRVDCPPLPKLRIFCTFHWYFFF
jgi:hypothetical protein